MDTSDPAGSDLLSSLALEPYIYPTIIGWISGSQVGDSVTLPMGLILAKSPSLERALPSGVHDTAVNHI